jgi:hypothetical protein
LSRVAPAALLGIPSAALRLSDNVIEPHKPEGSRSGVGWRLRSRWRVTTVAQGRKSG